MSRKPQSSTETASPKLAVQRIRIDKDGYDESGAYWGAGPDIYIATFEDGAEEITVRAGNVAEARKKAKARLTSEPGKTAPAKHEPIGGLSRHKSRYQIEWLNPMTGENVRIRIIHARDYLSSGNDHIEIESIKPPKAPLPISETGYRSHFISALDLINAGGAVGFVTAWIEQEAKGKAWTKSATAKAQGDLFQWAEARSESTTLERSLKPRRRDARPSGKLTRNRSPE